MIQFQEKEDQPEFVTLTSCAFLSTGSHIDTITRGLVEGYENKPGLFVTAPPLSSWGTLSELLNCSSPQLTHMKLEMFIVPTG